MKMKNNKKGFIRILETIMASIILLTALSFFFSAESPQNDWTDTLIQVQSQDALAVMYRTGTLNTNIMASDVEGMRNELKKLLPNNIDFSVEVRGIPAPRIRVGCDRCTDAEIEEIKKRLDSEPSIPQINYNGRDIRIDIDKVDITDEIPDDMDILMLVSLPNENLFPDIQEFMRKGRGLMLYKDLLLENLPQEGETSNPVIGEVFGITTTGRGPDFSSTGTLTNPDNVDHLSHNFYKFVKGISLDSTSFDEFHTDNNENRVISSGQTAILKSDSFSLVVATNFSGGKAVWFAGFDHTAQPMNGDEIVPTSRTEDLFKAAVMWLGDDYKMDNPSLLRSRSKSPPEDKSFQTISYYGVIGEEIYEIRLLIWKVFF